MTYPGQPQPGGAPNYGPPPGQPGYQQGYPQNPQLPAGYPPGYPQGPYLQARPVAPNGMALADFGDRFLAYLIDSAVLFAVNLVLFIPALIAVIAVIASAASSNSDNASLFIGVPLLIELGYIALTVVVVYVYHVEMFGRTGVTWGKRTMKLLIIRTDDPARPVDRGVLVRRWAVQFLVGVIVPFFSWVDNLWQLWDKPYQQCLHDKAAGTIVVKTG